MPSSDVAEGHARSEGTARAGIGMRHDSGHCIACRIQPRDRIIVPIEDLRVAVGLGTATCAESARLHPGSVVRCLIQHTEGTVGRLESRVTPETPVVVGVVATIEVVVVRNIVVR